MNRAGAKTNRDVERFDRWAGRYDNSFLQRLVFAPIHRELIRALGMLEGRAVLDVGCGTGILTLALATRAARAVGVDPAPRMVARAAEKPAGPNVWFAVALAESLPFSDSSFDAATASMTVHHWHDASRGFGELARILRPGAVLAIADIAVAGPLRRVLRLVQSPHAGFGLTEVTLMLTDAGFERVRTSTRRFIPFGPRRAIVVAVR